MESHSYPLPAGRKVFVFGCIVVGWYIPLCIFPCAELPERPCDPFFRIFYEDIVSGYNRSAVHLPQAEKEFPVFNFRSIFLATEFAGAYLRLRIAMLAAGRAEGRSYFGTIYHGRR